MLRDKPISIKEKQLLLNNIEKLYDKTNRARKWSDIVWATTSNAKYIATILMRKYKHISN